MIKKCETCGEEYDNKDLGAGFKHEHGNPRPPKEEIAERRKENRKGMGRGKGLRR